ncbi:MAG TPA: hypothetical protein VK206_17170 [Anaerolineales bacterium]|nr:hypothetical protein [Anaerolineales bacterium]
MYAAQQCVQGAPDLRQRAPEPHWHRTPVQVWWWKSAPALRAGSLRGFNLDSVKTGLSHLAWWLSSAAGAYRNPPVPRRGITQTVETVEKVGE